MEQTENYQLSLWNEEDRILMEDFNNDNAKIDAALQAEQAARETAAAALTAAVAKCGNCQVQFQTYTGTGSTSVSFTFPHKPLLIVIFGDSLYFFAVQGQPYATARTGGSGAATCSVTWSGNTASWSNSSGYQCNTSGKTYSMVVVMDVND